MSNSTRIDALPSAFSEQHNIVEFEDKICIGYGSYVKTENGKTSIQI